MLNDISLVRAVDCTSESYCIVPSYNSFSDFVCLSTYRLTLRQVYRTSLTHCNYRLCHNNGNDLKVLLQVPSTTVLT